MKMKKRKKKMGGAGTRHGFFLGLLFLPVLSPAHKGEKVTKRGGKKKREKEKKKKGKHKVP